MSNVTSLKNYIQNEAIFTREAVSESVFTSLAEQGNFAMDTLGTNHAFKYNGVYGGNRAFKDYLDGVLIFDWNAEIFEVQVFSGLGGASGTTDIDLQYSIDRGITYNSIFTTTPKIASTAASPTYVGIGETVTGCTAPVLISTPYQVVKGGIIRLKFNTVMQGAANLFVTLKYRPR